MQRLNRYQIVLAVLLAAAIAEETKVAEAADPQVAATVYGHHGGFYGHGPIYGLHHRGYFGHGYGHGHGHRYGRSVAADVEGQESHPGYYGGYAYRYGGYPRYGGFYPRYGYYHH